MGTARELPDPATMGETIVHVPDEDADAREVPRRSRYAFASGSRPLEGYTIRRAVGRGGFGEVYYATSDAGKEIALKLITGHVEVERRGVVQCMNLKSPHLIAIHDMKSNEHGDTFVIMEYVAGPSLANVLAKHPQGLPPADVKAWLRGLVEGVAYLHDHGIVHRDLKPANLFMEEGVVKIGDYGLSKLISGSGELGQSESVGTCHYMAPEIGSGRYHKPIDIYAIGVVLYEMITGRVPFEGETAGEVLMKHLTAMPDLSPLPPAYRAIVGKALAKNPAHRQARAFDLLGADAPPTPEVRIIGEPPRPIPAPRPTPIEEIHLLEAEEPAFYIGPETLPPRAVKAPRPERRAGPAVATVPLPGPPPLPNGRLRAAELAGSMVAAAPTTALLVLIAYGLFDAPRDDIGTLAMPFGATLLATWTALALGKIWEGRPGVEPTARRLVGLAAGLVVGGAGCLLQELIQVEPAVAPARLDLVGSGWRVPDVVAVGSYLALAYFAVGWWKLTDRARKARFRAWPAVATALIAYLGTEILRPGGPSWPFAAVALTAVAVQVVSPWDKAAAALAQYRARLAA